MKLEFERVLKAAVEVAGAPGSSNARDPHYNEVLYTLASYYIEVGRAFKDGESVVLIEERDIASTATELINKADAINNKNIWTMTAKGNLFLLMNRIDDALKQFKFVLESEPLNVSALLGMATAWSSKRDYKSALECYQRILCIAPDIKPDVRVAIGICYHSLHMHNEAKLAFLRAVELDPDNDDALVLLAIMEWNDAREADSSEALVSASLKINRAFTVNPRNPIGAILLGERALFQKAHQKVDIFYKIAVENTNSKYVRSDAFALKAKSLHSQGYYREALDFYAKAVEGNKSSPVHQFGLGCIYIFTGSLYEVSSLKRELLGEIEKACECFENVLKREPDNFETLKKLASLYSLKSDTYKKALECYARLKTLFLNARDETVPEKVDEEVQAGLIDDPEIQIELAQLYEKINPKIALAGYLNALILLETSPTREVPPELLNNIGALYHLQNQKGDLERANSFYERALSVIKPDKENKLPFPSITITYNLARLNEECGDIEVAVALHNSIRERHPSYLDSLLRLAQLALVKGGVVESRRLIKNAVDIDSKSIPAMLSLGNSYFDDKSARTNLKEAKLAFEAVLQKIDKHDQYALCSLGNVNLAIGKIDPKNQEVPIRRAFECFEKALRLENKNAYAAAGIGICLAEVGRLVEAREVLTQVQESSANLPTIAINLAHVLVDLTQLKPAIMLYDKVLKRNYENHSAYLLQCLARAYYIVAKAEKDPEAMLKSLNCLQRAIRIEPSKTALYYDLALAKQQYAQVLNEQPIDRRSVSLMVRAADGLEASRRLFIGLAERPAGSNLGYDVKHAKERAQYCKDVKRMSDKKIHETRILEQQREERLRLLLDEKTKTEQERRVAEKERQEAERKVREEIEEKRRAIMSKVQEDNQRSPITVEKKRVSKKSQDGFVSDGDKNSDEETEKGKRKKPRKERKRKRAGISSDEEGTVKRPKSFGKHSTLSKEFVDSDDE